MRHHEMCRLATMNACSCYADGIAVANVPTLLMVLVQLTGDRRWLYPPYRPTRTRGLGDHDSGGLSEAIQNEIRTSALSAIWAWSGGVPPALAHPTDAELVEMMSVCMGETVPDEYGPMITAELGLTRSVNQDAARPPTGFQVLIIGAGISGLVAAAYLDRVGIDYSIIEKNADVGGTWLTNRYPGCGVDTPSHLYSFSFAINDWKYFFAGRDELLAYIRRVAEEKDVRSRAYFNTEVVSATYDERTLLWNVQLRESTGHIRNVEVSAVISAVGAFAAPKFPTIEGIEEFQGEIIHTARWNGDIETSDRRVGVIGTGASSMQVVPSIAENAERVAVFQRSPQWVAPFENFQRPVPNPLRELMTRVPLYQRWYRLRLAWTFTDKIHASLQRDPSWPQSKCSVNAINDGHRRMFTRYMHEQLKQRPDLLKKALPSYPPFGKRMLLDNGWFRALKRSNVDLITAPISRITSHGVQTESGELHRVDMLVFATGFDVVNFLASVKFYGRDGQLLSDVWDGDDGRAYLGVAIPGFPNLFSLYGPNTQTSGGSVITIVERQMHYVISLLSGLFSQGLSSAEPRLEVTEDYNSAVDAAHERMIWTHPNVNTYYRNSKGRVVVINPFRMVDYWHMTQRADLDEFIVT